MNAIFNGLIFCFILLFSYLVFRSINSNTIEGLENQSSSADVASIAGKSASYAEDIKDLVTKKQDVLLIGKYRRDYENAIINASDLVDTLMLEEVMSIDTNKPYKSLEKLNILKNSKQSLDDTMKFLDKSK
jgi:hypothetical protein